MILEAVASEVDGDCDLGNLFPSQTLPAIYSPCWSRTKSRCVSIPEKWAVKNRENQQEKNGWLAYTTRRVPFNHIFQRLIFLLLRKTHYIVQLMRWWCINFHSQMPADPWFINWYPFDSGKQGEVRSQMVEASFMKKWWAPLSCSFRGLVSFVPCSGNLGCRYEIQASPATRATYVFDGWNGE